MCRERPWFTALCGIPLRSVVMDLGPRNNEGFPEAERTYSVP